jgi:hypothetical protein
MLVLKKNALICFSLIMTIYLKYKYKFKYKYKYKNELKRLEWIDEGVAEKLFLSAEMDSVISTPNFYGDYSVIDNKVPIVFAYTLKNVTGCVDSSSFYNEKYFFLERFQGINQRKANYASGHLMVNHYHFCLNYKYVEFAIGHFKCLIYMLINSKIDWIDV